MDFSQFMEPQGDSAASASADLTFLPEWNAYQWDQLLNYAQTQIYSAREVILRAGDTERALYVVAAGSLSVLTNRGKHRRGVPTATLEIGGVFGELTFLSGEPSPLTVQTLTECQLLYLGLDAFNQFAIREPKLARELLFDLGRILALQVSRLSDMVVEYWTR